MFNSDTDYSYWNHGRQAAVVAITGVGVASTGAVEVGHALSNMLDVQVVKMESSGGSSGFNKGDSESEIKTGSKTPSRKEFTSHGAQQATKRGYSTIPID